MSIIDAIVQGLIQGLTEFLPISSSGHLSIYQYFTGQSGEASLLFVVLLHFGTLVAIFIAFHQTIWELVVECFGFLKDLFTGQLFASKPSPKRRMLYLLALAEVPLLLVLLFKDMVTGLSTDNDVVWEGVALLITGVLLFLADHVVSGHKKAASMKPRDALTVGFTQLFATLPGISRSGSTLSAGLLCGLDRSYAVAFSFIMSIPAVLAANAVELKDALEQKLTIELVPTLIGITVAAISGLLAIKMVKYLVNTERLRIFSWYTFIMGTLVLTAGIIDHMTGGVVRNFFTGLYR